MTRGFWFASIVEEELGWSRRKSRTRSMQPDACDSMCPSPLRFHSFDFTHLLERNCWNKVDLSNEQKSFNWISNDVGYVAIFDHFMKYETELNASTGWNSVSPSQDCRYLQLVEVHIPQGNCLSRMSERRK